MREEKEREEEGKEGEENGGKEERREDRNIATEGRKGTGSRRIGKRKRAKER